jgi:hypothetical protein
MTETGDPVPLELEKPFLQKYGLYIVLALGLLRTFHSLTSLGHRSPLISHLFLVIAPGGEEGPRAP